MNLRHLNNIIFGLVLASGMHLPNNALAVTSTTVMDGSVEGTPFYRAPQFVVAQDGSLLVFAEGRQTLSDPGRGLGTIDLVMKRSTDMGATWSALTVLQTNVSQDYSGPAPIINQSNGQVILHYSRTPDFFAGGVVPTGTGANTFNSFLLESSDHGVTWSSPINITSQVKDPSSTIFAASPASGIQLRWQTDPSRNGRLVLPMFQSDAATGTRDLAMFNDANGLSTAWQLGTRTVFNGVSVNEADIVELVNGDLLMDTRPNNKSLPRQRFVSTDGGETWGSPTAGDIPMPSVDAGFARYTAKRDGDDRNRLVFSAPLGTPVGAANGRVNLGVWTSYDEGKTFINPVQIGTEADGYSNLQKLPGGRLGVIYETTEIGGGTAQFDIDRVMFVNLGLIDLEGKTHQRQLTHYDGFGNKIDRLRGGMGWSGSWTGSATVKPTGQLNYSGFRFDTERGHIDLTNGQAVERRLATTIDLSKNTQTYISLLVSGQNDTSSNGGNEFLDIELLDTQGVSHAGFGISSAEQFFVGRLGSGNGTAPGTVDRNATYFLVAKIVAQSSGFDQIFLKVFESGVDTIPDDDAQLTWTAVGGINENSSALIDRIVIETGLEVTWSIDELRIGNTFGAVASNLIPEPGSLLLSSGLIASGLLRHRGYRAGD